MFNNNSNRINARHSNNKACNTATFDGHVEAVSIDDLPTGSLRSGSTRTHWDGPVDYRYDPQ